MPKPKDWDEKKSGGWLGRKPGPYKWYELQDTVAYYEDFQKPKIVYPDIAITCRFCLDRDGYFPEATCFEIPVDDPYLVSILNSTLVFFYIRSLTPVLGDSSQRGRLRFKAVYLKNLPIRRISFTTPPASRAALFEEAKALYSAFLGAPASKDSSSSSGTAPNSLKILDFVSARLEAKPEESDVVHDLLAYLAERMIEMNKEKNAEIKGFLSFLEGEIGAHLADLSNKTAIQEYYKHEFSGADKDKVYFIEVLFKNKKKLKAGYDPKNTDNYKRLKEWHEKSVGKLAPLLKRIKAADELIDQIVYRLYGLTEEEIRIVEESVSGGKDIKDSKTQETSQ